MVVGGILITQLFDSVVALWRFLQPMSAFWGIAVWGGILWRRCNGYGAWAGILGSVGIWAYCNYELGLELQDMIVWYLVGGVLLMIVTSKSTPALSEPALDKFYDFMHTPVGQEQDLIDKGYEMRE
jgi:Na+/proline symporter